MWCVCVRVHVCTCKWDVCACVWGTCKWDVCVRVRVCMCEWDACVHVCVCTCVCMCEWVVGVCEHAWVWWVWVCMHTDMLVYAAGILSTGMSCHSLCQVTTDMLSPPETLRRTLLSAIEESEVTPTSGIHPESEVVKQGVA